MGDFPRCQLFDKKEIVYFTSHTYSAYIIRTLYTY